MARSYLAICGIVAARAEMIDCAYGAPRICTSRTDAVCARGSLWSIRTHGPNAYRDGLSFYARSNGALRELHSRALESLANRLFEHSRGVARARCACASLFARVGSAFAPGAKLRAHTTAQAYTRATDAHAGAFLGRYSSSQGSVIV